MKSLLILTGHSKGLGKAILERFLLEKSFHVIAVSRSISENQNENLTQVALDLSDSNGLKAKLPELFPIGKYSKVILINNAGWIGEVKPVGKLDPEGIRKVMTLNLLTPMVLSDAFVKAYTDSDAEKLICNISSGAAHKPMPGWAEYCSGKAGLAMFSKVAGEELGGKGFRVFSVAPGIVDTEMQAEVRAADQLDFPALDRFRNFKKDGQLSTPEAVAEKIFYLLTNTGLFPEVVQDVRDFDLP